MYIISQRLYNSVQDSNSDVIPELQEAILNYKSKLVSVGGIEEAPEAPTEVTSEDSSEATTSSDDSSETTTEAINYGSSISHNFSTQGVESSFFSFPGTKDTSNSKGTITYKGITLTNCLKVGTGTEIAFTAPDNGTLTLVFNPTAGKSRLKVNGTKIIGDETTGILTVPVTKGTYYLLEKTDSAYLYYIELELENSEPVENVLYGDVNQDNSITVEDASLLLQYILNKDTSVSEDGLKAAKVTNSTELTALDTSIIFMKALNSSFSFPIEKDFSTDLSTEASTKASTESSTSSYTKA